MATKVTVTPELLGSLVQAQAKHTAAILTNPHNRFGDDWGDDTDSALTLMQMLFNMYRDGENDLETLDRLLNTPHGEPVETNSNAVLMFPLWMLGCDGICPEIYALNCPALEG